MTRSVSDQLWRALHAAGADCVFGLPGTQTIDAFQALRRSGLRTVVATHEMAAAFMGNGYARASGRPGILTTIPGPGFTYAMTGLAEARLDSVPIVHVVPAAREIPDREFALQAINQRAMAGPIVKRIIPAVRECEVAAGAIAAYRLATDGEPGPVMLELPEEHFSADSSVDADAPPVTSPVSATSAQLDEMAKAIGFVHRKPGMSVEVFQRHWREVHGPLGTAIPTMRRYVQSHTRLGAYDRGREPTWDGIAIIWFDDYAAVRAATATPEWERAKADDANFIAPGPVSFIITTEYAIIG